MHSACFSSEFRKMKIESDNGGKREQEKMEKSKLPHPVATRVGKRERESGNKCGW